MHRAQEVAVELEQARAFFAEELRMIAGIHNQGLTEAFRRVPREQFLGSPPWSYAAGLSLRQRGYQTTSRVQDLYHDVVVALDPDRQLNTAQPSVMARLLDALDLEAGARVLHVGCGTGYYSALLAEVVGPTGSVVSVEIDPVLALQAATNLCNYPQVEVVEGDGSRIDAGTLDRVLVNAGLTHLAPQWIHSLAKDAVLVAPFFVSRAPGARDALVLRMADHGGLFTAEPVTTVGIYPCSNLQNEQMRSQLAASIETQQILRLKSMRVDVHPRTATCIAHGEAMCLSELSLDLS